MCIRDRFDGSDVYVSRALRIGWSPDSDGTYIVNGGTLQARQSISIAQSATGRGSLQILGSTGSVTTNTLLCGEGDAELILETDENGLTPLTVNNRAALGGRLIVRIHDSVVANEITLIDFDATATRTGGFREVVIEAPSGRPYAAVSYTHLTLPTILRV